MKDFQKNAHHNVMCHARTILEFPSGLLPIIAIPTNGFPMQEALAGFSKVCYAGQ